MSPDEGSTELEYTGRIKSKRKSYKESSKRSRLNNVDVIETEVSRDVGNDSLEKKLARLRREVAEVKAAFERKKTETESATKSLSETGEDGLDEVEETLHSINSLDPRAEDGAAGRLVTRLRTVTKRHSEASNDHSAQTDSMYTFSYAPAYNQEHTLAKVADFDSRLISLENVLGIDTIVLPSQARPQAKPILPTLENIDRQIAVMSTSTDSNIDSTNRKVRQLTQDAQRLTEARKSAKAAQEALSNSRNVSRLSTSAQSEVGGQVAPSMEDPEHVAKVNALYGTLPTIESLSPMLPPLLDRLRSLRSVHAEAAGANQSLQQIERRQEAMAEDLRNWRAGLEKVEGIFEQGQETMGENMSAIEGWVKELEQRMEKLKK